MKDYNRSHRTSWALVGLGMALVGSIATAHADSVQVNRFEPTSAGEWSFGVDHPWYSSMRRLAAGITFNYGHNPLVLQRINPMMGTTTDQTVIEHQIIAHVDFAFSLWDRLTISATLPLTLWEQGTPFGGIEPLSGTVGVGDPRLGLMVRLFGQPNKGPISLNIGSDFWIPAVQLAHDNGLTTYAANPQLNESGFRVRPKVVLAGLPYDKNGNGLSWSLNGAFYWRPDAIIGNLGPNVSGGQMGMQVQLGAALAYANLKHRFQIGAEAMLATIVGQETSLAFTRDGSALDIIPIGVHYNIAHLFNIGAAYKVNLWNQPGSADHGVLFRLAFAPMPKEKFACKDSDHDGVCDSTDVCPNEPMGTTPDPRPERRGCPASDRDKDGVLDHEDVCPDEPMGQNPDPRPEFRGCPTRDRDKDGVLDKDDICPDEPMGTTPDPRLERRGCPASDRDKDGVLDHEDVCPDEPMGQNPDPRPEFRGCPARDSDKDGVFDHEDVCPDEPIGQYPNPDPKRKGCPGLKIEENKRIVLEPLFFDTNKYNVVPTSKFAKEKGLPERNKKSLALIAQFLKQSPDVKRVGIHGYADPRGTDTLNKTLTQKRAQSVLDYLVKSEGIARTRLRAVGHGKIVGESTDENTMQNQRRIDFIIEQRNGQ